MSNTWCGSNPFLEKAEGEATDQTLVAEAVEGDQGALEALITRHQPWIYNLALRMVMVPQDAEDVTQEVLVKVLTKLGSYDPEKGTFRTWLYRVVTNHALNMKTRGYEAHISGFDSYYSFVEKVPDQEPDGSPESALIEEDLKIGCVMGFFVWSASPDWCSSWPSHSAPPTALAARFSGYPRRPSGNPYPGPGRSSCSIWAGTAAW